ncbi:MAG: acetate--CoA ligase family protein [archaeon]|nr:acetate--CoA ligase family protein [archaeon]
MQGFLRPKAIAIIGATNDQTKIGGMLVRNLINAGFDKSKIFPINPKGGEIQGIRAYKSVLDVGEPIDLAVISIKSAYVVPEMDNLNKANIRHAIILTAGFKEDSKEGAELERQLVLKAKEYGIRILGPNCFGMMDPKNKINVTFAKNMPKAGSLSILSQSGAVGSSMLDWACQYDVGIAKFITFGNKCDTKETEFFSSLSEDENTKVIGMYCEGIPNGKEFIEAIENRPQKKPIVIFKAGSTSAGGAAASSHTGSITGSDAVNDVIFKKLNIIRAKDLDELYDAFGIFHVFSHMDKNGIGIVTNAGGLGVMSADAAYNAKYIEAAKLADTTIQKIRTDVPTVAGVTNPIDVRGDAKAEYFEKTIKIIQEDPTVGGLVVMGSPLDTADLESVATNLVRIKDEIKVPFTVCWAGGIKCEKAADITRSGGIPTYPTPDRAIHALDLLRGYTVREQIPKTPMTTPAKSGRSTVLEIIKNAKEEGRNTLTESEGKKIFAAYNLPVPGEAIVDSAEKAAKACNEIGYPTVMKVVSPDIQHKSDVGGVMVGVKDETEAMGAFNKIMTSCKTAMPKANIVGISIQQMVSGKEVILSMIRDQQYGPIISFGLGGIFIEILKEISQAHAPMTEENLDEMIKSTKAYKLMSGARGTKKSDILAVKDTIRKLVQISIENPEIKELEINPVIVGDEGKGCWAVDALVTLV